MKTLCLMRHAKSAWDKPVASDHDRPLNKRGRRDAPLMAAYMKTLGLRPDFILCSPARRARQTLDAITQVIGICPVSYEVTLYMASPATILHHIADVDDAVDSLLVVGHNPGLGDLARMLADPKTPEYGQMTKKFPTAALVVFDAPVPSWRTIGDAPLPLRTFVTPKKLL